MTYDFDRETASVAAGGGVHAGTLSAQWNIGDNPNGGYMVALVLRAMADAAGHPDPFSVTTHFLRPGLAGEPCELRIDVLREGRLLCNVRGSLWQQDKPRLEVLAAFGDLGGPSTIDLTLTTEPPVIPPPERCNPRSEGIQGVHLPILERLDVRLDPTADPHTPAMVRGWIRLRDGRDPDPLALSLFVDAFPPSPLALFESVGWVPTLELTVHVRRRPAPGWVLGQFQTRDLDAGRMIEDGMLWDSAGRLVAQSRQLGLVLPRDR